MTDQELFKKFMEYAYNHGWTLEEAGKKISVGRTSMFNYKNGGAISARARKAMLVLVTDPVQSEQKHADPLIQYICESMGTFTPGERAEVVATIERIKERKKTTAADLEAAQAE